MKKKFFGILFAVVLAVSLVLVPTSGVLANGYTVDAGNPVINLNGNPSSGQTFYVGETITITGDVHSYAEMCLGGNGAWTEAKVKVYGPSGSGSDRDWGWDYSDYGCAVVDTTYSLTIEYTLTQPGTHKVYMYSYAEAASYWRDVDVDDFADDFLTFNVTFDIDIKPGSFPNSINLNSKGVVPVAVLDASTVDADTVKFAGASPVRWTLEDVDSDGDLDMLFHFKTQDLNDLDEDSTEAILTGETLGRQPFESTDSVNIVP